MEIKIIVVGDLEANCYLLVSENEIVIIDPGAEAEKILKEIEKIQGKVKYIINTHFHPDHTQANKEIKEKTKAKILIHEKEKEFIDFEVDEFLKNEQEIKIGNSVLKVIHTPGHSPGSICLLGQDFIFTGDTLFEQGYGRTDLAGGSFAEIKDSLNKLKNLLKPGTKVYPGHGELFKF